MLVFPILVKHSHSVTDLAHKLRRYIAHYNKAAIPFRWSSNSIPENRVIVQATRTFVRPG